MQSEQPEVAGSRLVWIIDAGFAALLIVSTVRYLSVHPFDGRGMLVLVLAVACGLAYAVAVVGATNAARSRIGIVTAAGLWVPLALLAPTFGWVAFALIFAVHRVLPLRATQLVSGAIVLVVCSGMFLLTDGQDPGLVLGPLLGGLVLMFVYFQLNRTLVQRNRLINELVSTREELVRSERETGALSERARVASELHDTVVQQTATALLLLESSNTEAPEISQMPQMLEARDVLRESLRETRQLMHGLTEPRTANQTLAPALAALVARYDASFTVVGEPKQVSDDVAHAVLRVAQEALINIDKHARATTVQVTLTLFERGLAIDIADNGVGFDPKPNDNDQPGYGLRAMAWRMENLGGTFTVETQPGRGTVVAGYLPETGDAKETT